MSNILNSVRYMPKSLVLFIAVSLALVSTVIAAAAVDVLIESDTTVRNITQGETTLDYDYETSAVEDDVVRFRVWYHNTELSGSGKIAENLSINVNFPTEAGATQVVTTSVKGDNTNTVASAATVTTGLDNARLEFIPGTVVWHHNIGTADNLNYVFNPLPDSVVTGDGFYNVEDQYPCFEFEASIYFDAKIVVDEEPEDPDMTIEKDVREAGNGSWTNSVDVDANSDVEYRIVVTNTGDIELTDVLVKDMLPSNQTADVSSIAVSGANASNTDQLFAGGLTLDSIAVGESVTITVTSSIDVDELECGEHRMLNKARVEYRELSREDSATVDTEIVCEFTYDCEALVSIIDMKARKVSAELKVTKSDDVTVEGYSIDFGDSTVVNEQTATHTYSQDGTYDIVGTVTFNVEGEQKTATCADSVTIKNDQPVCEYDKTLPADDPNCKPAEKCEVPGKTHLEKDDPNCKPTELPNTGPGGIIAALFGTGSAAAASRTWLASRRTLKESLLA